MQDDLALDNLSTTVRRTRGGKRRIVPMSIQLRGSPTSSFQSFSQMAEPNVQIQSSLAWENH